jgi:aspartyl-tRNA(Asn)/glutamyl-tRNA(Gln) amidotransferase subunit A
MHQILATQRATVTDSTASAISENARSVASGAVSSVSLTEQCLSRISDPAGEGKRTFVKVWADEARAVASAQDSLRKIGAVSSPIAGVPISVKDMLDVAGEVTLA